MTIPNASPLLVPELGCTDIVASRQFYIDVLGFTIKYERRSNGFVYLIRDGVSIMLEPLSKETWQLAEPEPPLGRGLHFEINVPSLSELHANCKAHGVVFVQELEEAWYRGGDVYHGQRQFVIADPDGYILRFAQSLGQEKMPPSTGRSRK